VQAIAQARKLSAVAPYFIDAERDDGQAATRASAAGAVGTENSAAAVGLIGSAGSAGSAASAEPIAGLTVIAFPNNHLIYALTWFGMAGLTLVGLWLFLRDSRRRRS
jgi:surfeit locus 1 family protein